MNKEEEFFVSSNIKYLRVTNNETQEELAKVLDKGFTSIGNYEKGIRNPDYMDLWKISQHYGITIDDLVKKDLRFQDSLQLDKEHELKNVIFNKTKELSEEDKQKIIDIIDVYTK